MLSILHAGSLMAVGATLDNQTIRPRTIIGQSCGRTRPDDILTFREVLRAVSAWSFHAVQAVNSTSQDQGNRYIFEQHFGTPTNHRRQSVRLRFNFLQMEADRTPNGLNVIRCDDPQRMCFGAPGDFRRAYSIPNENTVVIVGGD